MSQLDNLYREVIMEHFKHPRNKGLSPDGAYPSFRIKNPSCGDDITIQTKVENDIIVSCRHEGSGCSISLASASVLSEMMEGKSVSEAKYIAKNYLKMIANEPYDEQVPLEEAEAFSGVRQFPARVKCASIAWQAFLESIQKAGG